MNELQIIEQYINEFCENNAHPLDLGTINDLVEKDLDGNYALGFTDEKNIFIPTYVGKGNLHKRLYEHTKEKPKQDYFKFLYVENERESYNLECKMFHMFIKQLMNKNHPPLPEDIKCLYCDHVGS